MAKSKRKETIVNNVLGTVLAILLLPVLAAGFLWRAVVIAFRYGYFRYGKWDSSW